MREVHVLLHRNQSIAVTDRRLFGAFVEHLGRCVYGGIFEPGHPTADDQGFRRDVLALVRELAPTIMRYPGGNFVSGYNWEDGVGPRASRPRRLDLAWMSTETNTFGTNEFIDWCRAGRHRADARGQSRHPRTATPRATSSSTATIPRGTALSDLRRAHGWEKPHGVQFWCLGNEMDGPWQMEREDGARVRPHRRRSGQDDASGSIPRSSWPPAARPGATCRPSGRGKTTVLEHTFDHVEFISLHTYLNNYAGDTAGLPGQPRSDGPLHRRGGRDRRRGGRPSALDQAHHAELRRMERLVPHAAHAARTACSRAGRWRRRSWRRSTPWRTRSPSAAPASRCSTTPTASRPRASRSWSTSSRRS